MRPQRCLQERLQQSSEREAKVPRCGASFQHGIMSGEPTAIGGRGKAGKILKGCSRCRALCLPGALLGVVLQWLLPRSGASICISKFKETKPK